MHSPFALCGLLPHTALGLDFPEGAESILLDSSGLVSIHSQAAQAVSGSPACLESPCLPPSH